MFVTYKLGIFTRWKIARPEILLLSGINVDWIGFDWIGLKSAFGAS